MGIIGQNNEMIVSVATDKLLEILRANRATHIAEFSEAIEAYKVTVEVTISEDQGRLAKYLINFKKDPKSVRPQMAFEALRMPVCYEEEYDNAIGMLELHTGLEMKLDSSAYRRFIKDEWSWKQNFKAINSTYTLKG